MLARARSAEPTSSIGRWLGLAVIVVGYAVGSGLLEIAAIGAVTGYTPPEPLVAAGFLAFQAVALLSLAVLCSTRLPAIAGGAICVVAFGLAWMAGCWPAWAGRSTPGRSSTVADVSRWLLPTDGLWRGAIHGLEPSAVVLVALGRGGQVAEANPFFAAEPPAPAYLDLVRRLGCADARSGRPLDGQPRPLGRFGARGRRCCSAPSLGLARPTMSRFK